MSKKRSSPPPPLREPIEEDRAKREKTFKPRGADFIEKSGGMRPFKPGEKDYDPNPLQRFPRF